MNAISSFYMLDLQINGDNRGKLIALESLRNIPFEIKRVYYIFDTAPEWVRGLHAHPNLEQLVIALDGACEFVLDNGEESHTILLNRPDKALYIGKNVWREMKNFSYGCKLVVLASDFYDPKEYIRDYSLFLKEIALTKENSK